jgi:hypothetical protein
MKLPNAILCDIDGTLALLGNRNRFDPTTGDDKLNEPIAKILLAFKNQKRNPVELILITGREEKYREFTIAWLQKHGITHYKKLYMRKNKDFRKDFVIKKELFEKHLKSKYAIMFVLEDRDQVVTMWRQEGLTCLQVAPGNF